MRLGIPLQRLQAETTSSEFERWMIFLQQEETTHVEKMEFYMAALTAEVRRGWVTDDHRSKIFNKDFLINLEANNELKKKKVEKKPPTKKEKAKYLKKSKSHWLGFAQIKEK